jgi:hypothetical protein
MTKAIAVEIIAGKIFEIRGKKVMLDRDLAKLYGVETYRLNEQVKRNKNRFPDDFMLQLTKEEAANLISQIAISSWGGTRKLPYAFTQEGVAMLSSVLNSERAIKVNIQIMRVFVKLRYMFSSHKAIEWKLSELEKRLEAHDVEIDDIFEAIRLLMGLPQAKKVIKGFAR